VDSYGCIGASTVRIAAYTGGVMVPSARARVRQYIGPLRRLGIGVQEHPLPWGNILPRRLALRPLWIAATATARAATLTCSWNADVTWISRQLLPAFAPLHALAKHPMVLDVDDAVWLNTGGHRARDLARASDLIVCGNAFLANHFSHWNSNVTVIPTAVNTSWYRPHGAREAGGAGVLGWTGTSGNFPFLYAIEGALLRVVAHSSQAKLLVVADRPPQFQSLPASRVEFERWTPRAEQAAFDRMSIGLMPLADTDWCNGKCSYKMLCYMAAGLPVVVTAAGMNREVLALGEVGLSAKSEQQWVDALVALLDQPDLRRNMGAAGRAIVEERFSLKRLAVQYATVFYSLGNTLPRDHSLPNPI
jgi:glycosyltransferase involved in cell wall biosynthesis